MLLYDTALRLLGSTMSEEKQKQRQNLSNKKIVDAPDECKNASIRETQRTYSSSSSSDDEDTNSYTTEATALSETPSESAQFRVNNLLEAYYDVRRELEYVPSPRCETCSDFARRVRDLAEIVLSDERSNFERDSAREQLKLMWKNV